MQRFLQLDLVFYIVEVHEQQKRCYFHSNEYTVTDGKRRCWLAITIIVISKRSLLCEVDMCQLGFLAFKWNFSIIMDSGHLLTQIYSEWLM